MEAGRPPEGCKVMKAASRPPGVKTQVQDLYFGNMVPISDHKAS